MHTQITSHTIVFITGAFVSHRCWDKWITYYESKGYTCLAPAWPHKEEPAETQRSKHPNATVAAIRLNDLVTYYTKIIASLPEKPIIIGHSLGGLIVQLLLQQDLAQAGVAIHSAPPQGVLTVKPSFLKSIWGPMGFFTSSSETFLMSFPQWQYVFTNGMSNEEQKIAYNTYCIPESKLVLRDGLTSAAHITFKKPHAPLLFMAGSSDNIMPASLNHANYQKYKAANNKSVTDFKEFDGRNHFVLGQPTWKENAGYLLQWLSDL
jgi:pimeloyl-ACP methyl ester carboxylesterase